MNLIKEDFIFFDMEVYRLDSGLPVWAAGFRFRKDGEIRTEMIDSRDIGAAAKLRHYMRALETRDKLLVGYNLMSFDLPIVAEILSGRNTDIKQFSDNLIGAQNGLSGKERSNLNRERIATWAGENLVVSQGRVIDLIYRSPEPESSVDHIEQKSRSGSEFNLIGLKHFMTQLGEDITVLPYAPDQPLKVEEWEEVKEYCIEDLKATERVYDYHSGTIQALYGLSHKYKDDLINRTDSQVGEAVIRSEYEFRTGQRAPRVDKSSSFKVYDPGNLPQARSESFKSWMSHVLSSRFPMDEGRLLRSVDRKTGAKPDPATLEVARTIEIGEYRFNTGFGGLHQIVEPGAYERSETHRIVSVDVRSFYPSIAANLALPLGGMGGVGTEILKELMEERFRLKDLSQDERLSLTERESAKTASNALKIVINALFGRTGFEFSACYSIGTLYTITILGQIYLMSLIERLVEAGVRPIDSNTDGIYCLVPNSLDLGSILREWENASGFILEDEELEGFIVQAQNIRATCKKGRWSGKGSGFASISGRNPGGKKIDPPIVAKSVIEALVKRTPLSETIWKSTDPKDFILTKKFKKSTRVEIVSSGGTVERLDPLIRVYASNSGAALRTSIDRGDSSIPEHVSVAYKAPQTIPDDLDRYFYLGQARRLLAKFKGVFRESDLSGLAKVVWDCGLVPSPGNEKAALKGIGNKDNASSLEEWDKIRTIRAHTGLNPGGVEGARAIVAIDIDDPDRLRSKLGDAIEQIRNSECLTVYSGDSPDEVRSAQAKGKLIFEFFAPLGHRFRSMAKTSNKDLQKIGVEVFYGQRPLAVLGQGIGKEYKLAGKLSELPEWLEKFLVKHSGKTPPKKPGKIDPEVSYDHTTDPDFDEILEDLGQRFDERFRSVRYSLKRMSGGEREGVPDNRLFAVMPCPGGHDPHDHSKGMLILDWESGRPVYSCKNDNCRFLAEFRAWSLVESIAEQPGPEIDDLREGLPPLAQVMSGSDHKVLMIHAGTGAGKTHSAIDAIYLSYRQGRSVLFMTPTKQNLSDFEIRLKERYPDIIDSIMNLSEGGDSSGASEDDIEDGPENDEDVSDETGERFIPEQRPTIFLSCHEMSRRRGFSRYFQRVWANLRELKIPVDFFIDESHLYFRQLTQNIPLARRVESYVIGDKIRSRVVGNCPASNALHKGGTSSCEDCQLVQIAGCYTQTSRFKIPVIAKPEINDRTDPNRPLVYHKGNPVELSREWLELGPEFQVDPEMNPGSYYQEIQGIKGRTLSNETRKDLPRWTYKGTREQKTDEAGAPLPDPYSESIGTAPLVFEHIVGHMIGASVKTSYPTDKDGNRLTREQVLEIDRKERSKSVIYPVRACEVPRVQGIDAGPLEMLREYTEKGSRLVFMSASFGELDKTILDEVFEPEGWTYHKDPGQPSKINAIQVVSIHDPEFPVFLQGIEPKWLERWKEFGPGLLFAPCEQAMDLVHNAFIKKSSGSGRKPVKLNVQVARGSGTELSPISRKTTHDGIDLTIATPRKPVGTGYDGTEVVFAILDFKSTRLAEDLTVPGQPSPEDFRKAVWSELLDYLSQAAGRVGRGHEDKRAIVLILNAAPHEAERVINAGGLADRAESVGYSSYDRIGENLFIDGVNFLDGRGWAITTPEYDPKDHRGMGKGRKEATRQRKEDEILTSALQWKSEGKKLRDFETKFNIFRKDQTSLPGIRDALRRVWKEGYEAI